MPQKKEMPTQSEQYDHQLRSELYVAMLQLNEFYLDAEDALVVTKDLGKCATHINKVMDHLPEVIKCYFACIEGGKDV